MLSEPSGDTGRSTGLVTEVMAADWNSVDGCRAYLAGPPPMVEAATKMLQARGVPAENIHADAFYTAADREPAAPAPEEQPVQKKAKTACSCCHTAAS